MLAWTLLYFVLGVAGTWWARRYALRRDLLDRPGERRSHSVSTPRGGGIAIVLALLVATAALAIRMPAQGGVLWAFAVGLTLVAGVGWLDDHRPTSAWLRLMVHVVAGGLLAAAVWRAYGDPWLAGVAFIAAVVLVNVWNFMDGINGLAASQAALVALGMAGILTGAWAGVALALAAACVGFLPFNFPRARIFLGDVGSGALGYAVAALLVVASAMRVSPWPLLLLPVSAFLVDAGLTLLRRAARRERWWTAHAQHAYQVWARGRGHTLVTLAYLAWTLLAIIAMRVLQPVSALFMLCGMLACYMSCAFFWWLLQRRALHGR